MSTVTLHDGREVVLRDLDLGSLQELHWQEERIFAGRILRTPKDSVERTEAIRTGYQVVGRILTEIRRRTGRSASDPERNRHLILQLLEDRRAKGVAFPTFFEIGFGRGATLKSVADEGFEVGGLEVSPDLFHRVSNALPEEKRGSLVLGDFRTLQLGHLRSSVDLIYWNQVLEHVVPDEVEDYFRKIHELLAPGGFLVTITPNWHMRPSDVTASHRSGRTAPEGFHLKEYTLREQVDFLRRTGFERIRCPLLVLPRHSVLFGSGLLRLKLTLEPLLEYVPRRLGRKLAGGLGYYCSIGQKSTSRASRTGDSAEGAAD